MESTPSTITNHTLLLAVVVVLVFVGLAGGGFVAAQETANGTQNNSSQSLEPGVEIENGSSNLSRVILESVTLPENGYIVAYGENFTIRAPTDDSIVGRTQYVRSGQFSDVVIRFNETIPENTTVTVMVHNETNGNENFDFTDRTSPDGPWLNESGFPVADRVGILNNSTSTQPESFSPSRLSQPRNLPTGASGRLVIAGNSSGATYSFSATGNVTPRATAPNTTVNGTNVTGSINGSNSTFIYSGAISSFETNGNVSVRLNGRTVDPTILGSNWITLTKNGSEVQPGNVEYGFSASEAIIPGGSNEGNETVTNGQINGTIGGDDQTDTIYYAGQMTDSRLVGDAKVIINGRVTSESTGGSSSAGETTETPNLGQLPGQGDSSEGESTDQGGGPDFRVSNITLSSQRVEASQNLRVTVTITNTGSSQVTANLGLASEGQVVDSASAGLFAGASRQIVFEHTYEAAGEYVLQIALLNEEGEVLARSTVDQTVTVVPEGELTTTQAAGTNATSSGGPGFGIFAGVLGILTATMAIRYWRGSA